MEHVTFGELQPIGTIGPPAPHPGLEGLLQKLPCDPGKGGELGFKATLQIRPSGNRTVMAPALQFIVVEFFNASWAGPCEGSKGIRFSQAR